MAWNFMQQSACLVVNNYGFPFNFTTAGQALDSITAMAYSFNPLVGV